MRKEDTPQDKLNSKKEGRKIFLGLIGFFIIFAAVDAFFVYKAISTLPGVVSENAYEIGLNYNKIIAEAKKRKSEENGHSNAEQKQSDRNTISE